MPTVAREGGLTPEALCLFPAQFSLPLTVTFHSHVSFPLMPLDFPFYLIEAHQSLFQPQSPHILFPSSLLQKKKKKKNMALFLSFCPQNSYRGLYSDD